MSNVHQFQAGNTSADTTDEAKCDIEHGNVLDSGQDEAGLILDGRGRARVQSAMGGAKTICNILFQGEIGVVSSNRQKFQSS